MEESNRAMYEAFRVTEKVREIGRFGVGMEYRFWTNWMHCRV